MHLKILVNRKVSAEHFPIAFLAEMNARLQNRACSMSWRKENWEVQKVPTGNGPLP